MPERPWTDEYTLLCEKCGYVIEGLDTQSNCPECGRPIAQSLPERRVGTPWQQNPSVGSLVRTWWMTLRHPLRTLDVMRVDEHHRVSLWWWTLGTTVLLPAPVCLFALIALTHAIHRNGIPGGWTFTPGVLLVLIPILTATESLGLRVIARQRGFRIDRASARAITAHGAVGWVMLSTGLTLSFLYIALLTRMRTGASPSLDLQLLTMLRWVWVMILISLLLGFLFFETFAYLGLRRCKFANRAKAEGTDRITDEARSCS